MSNVKVEVGQVWECSFREWRYTVLRKIDHKDWWVDAACSGVRYGERGVSDYVLRAYMRLVSPAPYIPQVGDVVEWTETGAWAADVEAGDRGRVIGVTASGDCDVLLFRFGPSWYAPVSALRLVSRPDTATADAPRDQLGSGPCDCVQSECVECVRVVTNVRCGRGHRAYQGAGLIECEYCERIAEVEHEQPEEVLYDRECREDVWRAVDLGEAWTHPLRDGAVALWRAARIAGIDAEGRR